MVRNALRAPARRASPLGARVAEWQTRWIQNPVSERACGFDSHLWYFILAVVFLSRRAPLGAGLRVAGEIPPSL